MDMDYGLYESTGDPSGPLTIIASSRESELEKLGTQLQRIGQFKGMPSGQPAVPLVHHILPLRL